MFPRVFNSTIFFIAAYFIVHVYYLIVKYLSIQLVDISDAYLYFTDVYFYPWQYDYWSKTRIFLVYGFPTFACLFLTIMALIPFAKLKRSNSRLESFLLWLVSISGVFVLADFIRAPFISGTLASVYQWFYIPQLGSFFIAVICIPILPLMGFFIARYAVKSANSREFIRTRGTRVQYFASVAFIPMLITLVVLTLLLFITGTYPVQTFFDRELIRFITLGIAMIFGLYFSHSKKYINIRKSSNIHYVNKEMSALIIIAMLLVYFVLWFAI